MFEQHLRAINGEEVETSKHQLATLRYHHQIEKEHVPLCVCVCVVNLHALCVYTQIQRERERERDRERERERKREYM